jgi:hypothetical protein
MDSKKQAQGIAALGRYGDTTLMHMRPDEVEQLTAISRANGGDITINPKTGMPEAFLGDFFSAMAPTAAGLAVGAMFPGAYAPYLAAGAGGLTAYAQGKRDPLSIGMGALGGYGGGNIGQGLVAQGSPGVTAGSAEASAFTPTDTTQGINMSTGQAVGGANAFTPDAIASGSGANLGSPALTSAGGRGIAATTPTKVYQPNFNTPYKPNQPFMPNQDFSAANPRPDDFNYSLPTNEVASNAPRPDFTSTVTPQVDQALPPLTEEAGKSVFQQGFEYGQGQVSKLGSGIKNVVTDSESRSKFFSDMGGGNETYGMFKTAMPVIGAGAETYMKQAYENMLTPEMDTMRYYDPTRKLNLSMDTGLRLLAKGGKVNYEEGGIVRDRSYYGIEPQYNTVGYGRPGPFGSITPVNYAPSGPFGGGLVPITARQPVQGFVDVGGKFKADPAGNITDVEYEDRFKYVTEGVKKPEDQDGDFDSLDPTKSGAGIDPAMALNLAQGYAESQQSDTAETGLGGLRKGGAIKYQQGGKTTAEQNTAKAATPPPATTMDMLVAKKNEEEMAKQGIPAGINMEAIKKQAGMADGGLAGLTPDDGKMLNGMGDGVSDDIPAMIEGEQEAALSDGEFIVPARIVSELGNGSSDAGAQKLYSMIDRIQAARKQTIGDDKQYAKDTNAERFLPA